MWEGVGDRTELQHIDPHSIGHNLVSFPFSWAAQQGAWGPSLSMCWFSVPHLISNLSDPQLSIGGLRVPSAGCWFSLPHLISSSSDPTGWIFYALRYIIVHRPPYSCGRHNFALIQPVHGQGYNILIFLDRMLLLFTQVHFLFWQPGRVGGQYATILNIIIGVCNTSKI